MLRTYRSRADCLRLESELSELTQSLVEYVNGLPNTPSLTAAGSGAKAPATPPVAV